MKLWTLPLSVLLVLTACTPSAPVAKETVDEATNDTTTTAVAQSYSGTVDAPALSETLDWINTTEPIALSELINHAETVVVDPVSGAAGQATIVLNYRLPDGYKVNEDAPSSLVVAGGRLILDLSDRETGDLTGTTLPASVSVDLVEGEGDVTIDVTLIYCDTVATSLCLIDQVRYEIQLVVGPAGPSTQIVINRTIPNPG